MLKAILKSERNYMKSQTRKIIALGKKSSQIDENTLLNSTDLL